MDEGIKYIDQKIGFFKRRYYLNLFIRGAILVPAFVLGYLLVASLLEYNLWLDRTARFFIFILFFLLVGFCFFRFLWKPISWWIYKKGIGEEESAKIIGNFFPTVADRLINIIQLASLKKKNSLLEASIAQKSGELRSVPFEKAVDINANKKYLRYLVLPVVVILFVVIIDRNIFTKSAVRIVKFNQEFSPEAPFHFTILNKTLTAFFNEDFKLNLSLKGSAIPESAHVILGNQRWKMENTGVGNFQFTFEKVQRSLSFQIEASGFYSELHKINLVNRPEVTQLKISFSFPPYLGRHQEEITNAGNIEIPEGTRVTWMIEAAFASKGEISFASDHPENMQLVDNQSFTFGKNFNNPDQYSIVLENESSKNKDRISYSIDVIKDQYPEIFVENLRDSILYKSILLGGHVKDDYGISELSLNYSVENGSYTDKKKTISIPVTKQAQQNFFYSWGIDSLHLKPGEKITYYFEVWDNDGVNGRKATRSSIYTFMLPTEEQLKNDISNQQESAENKIDKSVQKAKNLKQSIDEAQQKLRGKQSLDWQDKKLLEDMVEQKEKLDQAIEELQKENKLLEQKKKTFTEENERIKEKSEQLQKLMDELLDGETKKLFKELEKLLKENADLQQVQKLLDKMDRKEIDLEKELERTLSLFKQLQYDYKLDQAINEIKSQIEQQEKLLDQTEETSGEKSNDNKEKSNSSEDKNNGKSEKKSSEQLAKDQEDLKKEVKNLQDEIEDLKKIGKEIDREEGNVPSQEDFEQLENSEEQSQKSLEQGNPKKSTGEQKKSLSQMKQMQKQLQGMQNSMEMEIDVQNLESLRQIVHGLIKLSFDQENLMKEFAAVQQSDPRYIQISQSQLKLHDDSKMLEDSLLDLSKKDPFMGSIVIKEIGELNDHIDKAVENIRERRKSNAGIEMQFSMTNINNLALMLNDHFEMLMNMMANSMPSKGKGNKGKKLPSLGKMQQEINDKIEQLKNGQKTGRQYSEELARMAAEQARIRKALQEMQEKLKKEGGQIPGNDIPGKMEQTELDLVNKQITEQTIRRQKEILTRLLETEKSMREQNLDDERKGEAAKDYNKEIPRAFEEYLRLKEKEVELLKTLPPKFFPYYKREVNEYFKRIN